MTLLDEKLRIIVKRKIDIFWCGDGFDDNVEFKSGISFKDYLFNSLF